MSEHLIKIEYQGDQTVEKLFDGLKAAHPTSKFADTTIVAAG